MPFAVGFTAIGMSPERATLKIFDAILHSLALYFLYLQDDWLMHRARTASYSSMDEISPSLQVT